MNDLMLEIEKETLCSMMMDKDALLQALLKLQKSDFADTRNQIIFENMLHMYKNNEEVDLTLLAEKLNSNGFIEMIGGIKYLMEISMQTSTSAKVKAYISKLVQRREKNQYKRWAAELINKINNDDDMQALRSMVMNPPSVDDSNSQLFTFGQIYNEFLKDLVERKKNGEVTKGIPTGFYDYDAKTGGANKGELIIIGGRPAMGKTAFGLNVASNMTKKGFKGVIFSLEMTKEQLVKRMQTQETHITNDKIKFPNLLRNEDIKEMRDSQMEQKFKNLLICDKSAIPLSEIRMRCKEAKLMMGGLDFVLIDYLQIMGSENKLSGRELVEHNSKGLKTLAKDFGIPVIALAQLSRLVEQRQDKRPMLSDLRETGQIEQDADVVCFLYRDEYYKPSEQNKGLGELIVSKVREGSTGKIDLRWIGERTTYLNLARG